MARRTIEQKIAHLDEQKRSLQARLSKQERARETRRKILLGALVLQRVTNSASEADVAWLKSWMSRELPAFLTRDIDRLLLADLFEPVKPSIAAANDADVKAKTAPTTRVLVDA